MKGLGDVVHAPDGKGFDLVLGGIQGTDKNNRYVAGLGIPFQVFAHLVAIHLRHPDVEQNQVGGLRLRSRHSQRAVGHRPDSIPLLGQHLGKQV